ncbi:MAG TPA: DNA-3-methyladenine glycosylase [Patescibacteria group bacterium]|nr:DNA-3-methyladenine glycosylase [Patescibacteria group bacterium]
MKKKNNWIEAERLLSKDKYIGPLIKKWGHCTIKPIKKQNYFEDLVDAICSQQLSGKAAKTIFTRVKNLLMKITPENIIGTNDQKLRDCGLSWQKVSYIRDLATKVTNGELNILILNKLSDEEVINKLVAVKGIGRWTAEMFLMFSLARPDIFPKDDLGIQKAMKNLKIKNSNRWKPYRTIASWYLWRSLENR